jgi:hypothetical protein
LVDRAQQKLASEFSIPNILRQPDVPVSTSPCHDASPPDNRARIPELEARGRHSIERITGSRCCKQPSWFTPGNAVIAYAFALDDQREGGSNMASGTSRAAGSRAAAGRAKDKAPQPVPGNGTPAVDEPGAGNLDRVRDILFGAQVTPGAGGE